MPTDLRDTSIVKIILFEPFAKGKVIDLAGFKLVDPDRVAMFRDFARTAYFEYPGGKDGRP